MDSFGSTGSWLENKSAPPFFVQSEAKNRQWRTCLAAYQGLVALIFQKLFDVRHTSLNNA